MPTLYRGVRARYALNAPVVVVGRDAACDITLKGYGVSRRHCQFVREGDTYFVEDLGSANGTYVNRARVLGKQLLREGDKIAVMGHILTYRMQDEATDVTPAAAENEAAANYPPTQRVDPDELLRRVEALLDDPGRPSGDDERFGEAIVCEHRPMPERGDAMKVRLTAPELVERRPDGQSGVSGRYLTTWRGKFEGGPDQWWREAFAMWVGEDLQGICSFRITTWGYEFECGEDEIDDIVEKLVTAAEKAGPTGNRNRAKDRKHEDTQVLFAKVEAIKSKVLAEAEEAARRELQERMAKKFKGLER